MPRMRLFNLIVRSLPSPSCLLVLVALMAAASLSCAQDHPQPSPQPQSTPPPGQQQPDQAAPDSGGPGADPGAIALPKKKDRPDDTPPPAPAAPKIKVPEGAGNYSLRIEVPRGDGGCRRAVGEDAPVRSGSQARQFPRLRGWGGAEGGRIQAGGGAYYSAAVVRIRGHQLTFIYDMRNAAWSFAQQLRPQDYVAMMTFDMHTQLVTDFTQDKRQLYEAINSLRIPGFNERNLFDALYESLDRLEPHRRA